MCIKKTRHCLKIGCLLVVPRLISHENPTASKSLLCCCRSVFPLSDYFDRRRCVLLCILVYTRKHPNPVLGVNSVSEKYYYTSCKGEHHLPVWVWPREEEAGRRRSRRTNRRKAQYIHYCRSIKFWTVRPFPAYIAQPLVVSCACSRSKIPLF